MDDVQDRRGIDELWVTKQVDAFENILLHQCEPVLTRELFLRWSSDQGFTQPEKEAVWNAFEAERREEEI